MSILLIVEHNNQVIKTSTTHALSAAKILSEKTGDDIIALVSGENCASVANAVANMENIEKVFHADCSALAHHLPENVAPLITNIVTDNDIRYILAASSTMGKNVLPRVAASLDVAQISDVTEIVDTNTFVRPIYAGNALETVTSADLVKVLTVRASSFEAAPLNGGSAVIEKQPDVSDHGISRFISEDLVQSDRPELTSAKVVISGGRGLKSGENFKILESLADKLGGAVGASRAAVDAGYVSNDMQVGQTGKIVSPDLYIAAGISGAIQHLAGMKDSKIIVAINNDPEAPIFNIADYGLVADLFEAVPELESTLG
ncbi:MAG: electron transfer flavoprotein subunit alpha/FixB family protein [Arenicella sp.]